MNGDLTKPRQTTIKIITLKPKVEMEEMERAVTPEKDSDVEMDVVKESTCRQDVSVKKTGGLMAYLRGVWKKITTERTADMDSLELYYLSVYIGQSGRRFEIRIEEHERAFRLKQNSCTYANHLLDENYTFGEDVLSIIHFAEKVRKMYLLEVLDVHKTRINPGISLLNDQVDLMYTPLFEAV